MNEYYQKFIDAKKHGRGSRKIIYDAAKEYKSIIDDSDNKINIMLSMLNSTIEKIELIKRTNMIIGGETFEICLFQVFLVQYIDHVNIIDYIYTNSPNIDASTNGTVLEFCIKWKKYDFVQRLMYYKVDLYSSRHELTIGQALYNNDIKMIDLLTDNGYDINHIDKSTSNSAIVFCCCFNEINIDTLKYVLDKGGDKMINELHELSKMYPIEYSYNNVDKFKLLIKYGADITKVDWDTFRLQNIESKCLQIILKKIKINLDVLDKIMRNAIANRNLEKIKMIYYNSCKRKFYNINRIHKDANINAVGCAILNLDMKESASIEILDFFKKRKANFNIKLPGNDKCLKETIPKNIQRLLFDEKEKYSTELPNEFICTICHEPFCEPVTSSSGETYCKECIEGWYNACKGKAKDPVNNKDLTDNFNTNNLIERMMKNYIVTK